MSSDTARAWMIGLGVAAAVWLAGWLVTNLLVRWLRAWAKRTSFELDDLILRSLRPHIPIWFLAVGATAGARFAPMSSQVVHLLDQISRGTVVVSIALAAANFVVGLLEGRARGDGAAAPVNTLIRTIVYLMFLSVAAMMILGGLGISITPLLTALGVGSLAIALALQPTLSNLFAGVHLLLTRQIRVGDVIELESGQQGVVADITFRSTLLREMPDNAFIVPNSRLAEMIVKNYGLPSAEHNLPVPFGVGYGADLDRVRAVTLEVARETQRELGRLEQGFEPAVLVRGFGDSAIDHVAVLRVPQFVDRAPMTDDFLRRLHRRFRAEGIEIPYPQLVVHRPHDGKPGAPPKPGVS